VLSMLAVYVGTSTGFTESYLFWGHHHSTTPRQLGTQDWGYLSQNGPHTWCPRFTECCGSMQSPININTHSALAVLGEPLRLHRYSCSPAKWTMTNNDRTVGIIGEFDNSHPFIEGGGLPAKYVFNGLHFHWGEDNNIGAEHRFNSKSFPLEAHLVHIIHTADSLNDALRVPFGVAVVGVLFELSLFDNVNLFPITGHLNNVIFKDMKTSLDQRFNLGMLLPETTGCHYHYIGSLTTPNCTESVVWTVMAHTVPISTRQLSQFRHLSIDAMGATPEVRHLVNNFRPVQPLNGRDVYRFGCTHAAEALAAHRASNMAC